MSRQQVKRLVQQQWRMMAAANTHMQVGVYVDLLCFDTQHIDSALLW